MKNKKLFFTFVIFSIFNICLWAQEDGMTDTTTDSTEYSMESLLSSTQANHPELLKLQEEYRRSILDLKDAWWSLGPTIDLQASGTFMVNPPLGAMYINTDDLLNSIQWNGVKPKNSSQRIKIYEGMESTLYNFELSVTQPIFTWGKITNAIKLYKQVADIKELQISQQSAQLETELKTRLISLYYMKKILEIIY